MFDSSEINIPCPECGCETTFLIKELGINPSYTCWGCHKIIHINADELSDSLDGLNKELGKFKDIKLKFDL